MDLIISLNGLIASLEAENKRVEAAGRIDTTPPEGIFSQEPAILILIDGEPHLVDLEDTQVKRVVNTAFSVLYAVTESEAAKAAVLDAQIPQTAAIDRSKASLEVEYDPQPKFESIETTTMAYAVNTATPVIRARSAPGVTIEAPRDRVVPVDQEASVARGSSIVVTGQNPVR